MSNVIEIGDRRDYVPRGDAEDGPAAKPSPGDPQDPPAPLKHEHRGSGHHNQPGPREGAGLFSVAARRAALERVVDTHNGSHPFSSADLERAEREESRREPWIAAQVLLDHLASRLEEDHRVVRDLTFGGAVLVLAALVLVALLGPGRAAWIVLLCSTIVSGGILVLAARRIFFAQVRVRIAAERMDVLEELTSPVQGRKAPGERG